VLGPKRLGVLVHKRKGVEVAINGCEMYSVCGVVVSIKRVCERFFNQYRLRDFGGSVDDGQRLEVGLQFDWAGRLRLCGGEAVGQGFITILSRWLG